MGPVGGALSPLHPPCSKAHSEFTSKTTIDVPWSFVQCHRARSSEIGLLEQTQFLPVFPTLYRVLGSEPWGLVILHVLFVNLSWEVFPGAHCSIEKLLISMCSILLSRGCALWIPFCQSHSRGDLLFTEPLSPQEAECHHIACAILCVNILGTSSQVTQIISIT